jgi:uncharacterized protein (TIGR00255 family)
MSSAPLSMTGFARNAGSHEGTSWAWELRSVNAKGFELKCRMGPWTDRLEPECRKRLAAKIKRGTVNLGLRVESPALSSYSLDEDWLARLQALCAEHSPAPSLVELLALPGVLRPQAQHDEDSEAALVPLFLASLDRCIDDFLVSRQAEGALLAQTLASILSDIETSLEAAKAQAKTDAGAFAAKIQTQIEELFGGNQRLDPQRLAQEAALLAVKGDVAEELQRLEAHIIAARKLLASAGPKGRALDHLCQEFMRESNTLCSKSTSIPMTNLGLALKSSVDQLREQCANLE